MDGYDLGLGRQLDRVYARHGSDGCGQHDRHLLRLARLPDLLLRVAALLCRHLCQLLRKQILTCRTCNDGFNDLLCLLLLLLLLLQEYVEYARDDKMPISHLLSIKNCM